MGNSTATLEANLVGPFRKALRDLGYVEGRDIVIEYRWRKETIQRFPALVAELIASGVDVIVTAGTPAAFAVKNATNSVPCVMVGRGRSRRYGPCRKPRVPRRKSDWSHVDRPGSGGEAVALLREMIPTLSHFAVLWNPPTRFMSLPSTACRLQPGVANEDAVAGRADVGRTRWRVCRNGGGAARCAGRAGRPRIPHGRDRI